MRLFAHGALPRRPAARSTQKGGSLLARGFGEPRGLLIARSKRPLFTSVSVAHHYMLGLPESDGFPVPSVTGQ